MKPHSLFCLLLPLLGSTLLANVTAQPGKQLVTIKIGMSVDTCRTHLSKSGVKTGGAKAFAAHPQGDRWLFYSLAPQRIDLVVRYAPRTKRITGITLYYLGTPRAKSNAVAVGARSITFHPDRSYSVHFDPPFRAGKKTERRKSVLPPFKRR